MPKLIKTAAMALAFTGLALGAVSAEAHDRGRHHGRHGDSGWHDGRGYGSGYGGRGYYRGGRYRQSAYAGPVWRGRDGRYHCRREDGTTGLLIGAVVGGAIGHEVAGYRGDRTLGVLLGAAGGALLGRAIDRGDSRCR